MEDRYKHVQRAKAENPTRVKGRIFINYYLVSFASCCAFEVESVTL